MTIQVYNIKGKKEKEVTAPAVWGTKINPNLIYTVYNGMVSSRRKNIAHAKGRGEVAGGGKKPWKQKGTGRARHGSIRSPIWKGGGVTFGPTNERNYVKKINQKAKLKALKMVLSSKLKDQELLILENIPQEVNKTKDIGKILDSMFEKKPSSAILATGGEKNLFRIGRNLPYLTVLPADQLDVVSLLDKKYLIITESGWEILNKKLLK